IIKTRAGGLRVGRRRPGKLDDMIGQQRGHQVRGRSRWGVGGREVVAANLEFPAGVSGVNEQVEAAIAIEVAPGAGAVTQSGEASLNVQESVGGVLQDHTITYRSEKPGFEEVEAAIIVVVAPGQFTVGQVA